MTKKISPRKANKTQTLEVKATPIQIESDGNRSKEDQVVMAKAMLSPAFLSTVVIDRLMKPVCSEVSFEAQYQALREQIKEVKQDDLSGLENLLVGQALTLQAMFASLMTKTLSQEYLKQYTTFANLALKAQAQSRATIETLGLLRNPRAVIVTKQANIAQQQVNHVVNNASTPNLKITRAPAHAEVSEIVPNKLLATADVATTKIKA